MFLHRWGIGEIVHGLLVTALIGLQVGCSKSSQIDTGASISVTNSGHAKVADAVTGAILGNFSLLNESATAGNSMTILSGVSSEGDNLVTYWTSATPGFEIVTMGNSQYEVVELLGGRCLTLNGSAVTITTCSGASNQLFSLNLQSDGSYTIASGGGKCVEAPGAFAAVAAAPCAASSSQYWMITGPVALNPGAPTPTPAPSPAPTPSPTPSPTPTPAPSPAPTPSPTPSPAPANSGPNAGIYQIQSIAYSLELTVGNGQASAGDQLVTYFANSALGEEFKVVLMGSGQFEIQEQTLGYCLTVNGNSLTTQTCDGDAGQLFALTLNKGDGAYTIVDQNGLCVNESVAYGTISEATCNGSSGQLWYFTLISSNPYPGPTPAPSPTPSPTPASGATPGSPSALPALAQKFRLMTLGDSMTGGYGGADQEGYRGPLYNMLVAEGYSPQMTGQINCGATTSTQYPLPSNQQSCDGIGGEQIAALDSSIVSGQWVANENPDVVLLWIGFNSVYYTTNTTAQDLSQLNQMINDILLQKPNVRLIVAQLIASTQCCGTGLIAQYNAGIPSLVSAWANQGYHVSMANLYGTSSNPVVPPNDLYDYVHPNDAGYDLVANVWLQSINAVAGAMTASNSNLPAPIAAQNDVRTFSGAVYNGGGNLLNGVEQCCMNDSTDFEGKMYPTTIDGGSDKAYPVAATITQIEIKERTSNRLRYRVETGGGWCSFEAQSSLIHGDDKDFVLTTSSPAACSG